MVRLVIEAAVELDRVLVHEHALFVDKAGHVLPAMWVKDHRHIWCSGYGEEERS